MLHRLLMDTLRLSPNLSEQLPDFYLYFDASPQKWGLELFATSYDCYVNGVWFRRYVPFLALDRTMLDCAGKSIALLLHIFLLFDKSWDMMRWFLSSVVGICTDLGSAERRVVKTHDILPFFYY